MEPSERQIRELMTTVACTVCGTKFQPTGVEVLGHRAELWFLRVTCAECESTGLVAAMVATSDSQPEARISNRASAKSENLDRARSPGPVTEQDVWSMRSFLASFDGDFQRLFAPASRHRPAA